MVKLSNVLSTEHFYYNILSFCHLKLKKVIRHA